MYLSELSFLWTEPRSIGFCGGAAGMGVRQDDLLHRCDLRPPPAGQARATLLTNRSADRAAPGKGADASQGCQKVL